MTQRKGEILIPRVDFEQARITTRRAPTPRRHAGIGGWLEWQLIDRQGRAVKGGDQHNLFLNQGLDQIALGFSLLNNNPFSAAVSTDSTEPDVTDTTLAGQIATTTTTYAQSAISRESNGVYLLTQGLEFDFNVGNGNLTKWGIFRGFGGGTPLMAAELFRDSGGTPIVITKTSDYKLRISYSLRIALSPVTPQAGSFTVAGIGLINGDYQWIGGPDDGQGWFDLKAFNRTAAADVDSGGGQVMTVTGDLDYINTHVGGNPSGQAATSTVHSTFVPGVWERSASGLWGTSAANGTVEGVGLRIWGNTNQYRAAGFKFMIDEGDHFTKDNEHTLSIDDVLTVTWGRA